MQAAQQSNACAFSFLYVREIHRVVSGLSFMHVFCQGSCVSWASLIQALDIQRAELWGLNMLIMF
jgi:hypothetical protein